jgi:hypothetical protein
MSISYSLKITQMDVEPHAEDQVNVVVCAHWAYTGTENNKSAGYGGKTYFTYTSGDPFTPYDQLTEDQVSGWVLGAWTPDQKSIYESAISASLASQAEPLPWGGKNTIANPVKED